jgi:hypothetical protein
METFLRELVKIIGKNPDAYTEMADYIHSHSRPNTKQEKRDLVAD